MSDRNSSVIGYCCNVHPGRSLSEVRQGLQDYSLAVKRLVAQDVPLGIGLWFSVSAARELLDARTRREFGQWLAEVELLPYTLNGFPYGDFHDTVVKHQVYQPSWAHESRLSYTLDLVTILDELLPPGSSGTISTLPLGWPLASDSKHDSGFLRACATNLRTLAGSLADLRDRTGRQIMICLEPEPGCILNSAADVVRFFVNYLGDSTEVRDHLGVCHDICHSAVMFEEQRAALRAYREAGISIGKAQVSSAISLDFDQLSPEQAPEALNQLEKFAEPRYLHQTVWSRGGQTEFFDDLPQAITAVRETARDFWRGQLRVHFHVPIFSEKLELLATTQADIAACLTEFANFSLKKPFEPPAETNDQPCRSVETHFEVETYAWNVLPEHLRPANLSEGIAKELFWLRKITSGH